MTLTLLFHKWLASHCGDKTHTEALVGCIEDREILYAIKGKGRGDRVAKPGASAARSAAAAVR